MLPVASALRETLMIKVLPKELSETMNGCIHIVNFVKPNGLNSRIFSLLCEEKRSEHQPQYILLWTKFLIFVIDQKR